MHLAISQWRAALAGVDAQQRAQDGFLVRAVVAQRTSDRRQPTVARPLGDNLAAVRRRPLAAGWREVQHPLRQRRQVLDVVELFAPAVLAAERVPARRQDHVAALAAEVDAVTFREVPRRVFLISEVAVQPADAAGE